MERREPPASLVRRIGEIGGYNFRGQPNFRVIWGWNHLEKREAKWADFDDNGTLIREVIEVREEPYCLSSPIAPGPPNRWYCEVWCPPEYFGTPESWQEYTEYIDGQPVATMGPFPNEGRYEPFWVLQTPAGAFVDLTPAAAEMLVEMFIASRELPLSMKRAYRKEQEGKAVAAQEAALMDRVSDIVGPETPKGTKVEIFREIPQGAKEAHKLWVETKEAQQ